MVAGTQRSLISTSRPASSPGGGDMNARPTPLLRIGLRFPDVTSPTPSTVLAR